MICQFNEHNSKTHTNNVNINSKVVSLLVKDNEYVICFLLKKSISHTKKCERYLGIYSKWLFRIINMFSMEVDNSPSVNRTESNSEKQAIVLLLPSINNLLTKANNYLLS